MNYFFINTDTVPSAHDLWVKHGYAFSGGPIRYGKKFRRLVPGDRVFAYTNRQGVVAVGEITEYWDGVTYKEPLVYTGKNFMDEYRIKVKWLRDIRHDPISPSRVIRIFGWNPHGSLQQIRRDEERALELYNTMTTPR